MSTKKHVLILGLKKKEKRKENGIMREKVKAEDDTIKRQ